MCTRCYKQDLNCHYSLACRAGKPKGSKNKSTLKKLEHAYMKERFERWSGGKLGRYDGADWEFLTSSVPSALSLSDEQSDQKVRIAILANI
jgi:hypothetical protein